MQSLSDAPGHEYSNQNMYSLSKISLDTEISIHWNLISDLLDLNEFAMKQFQMGNTKEGLEKLV